MDAWMDGWMDGWMDVHAVPSTTSTFSAERNCSVAGSIGARLLLEAGGAAIALAMGPTASASAAAAIAAVSFSTSRTASSSSSAAAAAAMVVVVVVLVVVRVDLMTSDAILRMSSRHTRVCWMVWVIIGG